MHIITQEAKKKQAVVKYGRRFVLSLDMLYVIIIRQLLSERQMFMITVGNAELKDAERLLEIYDYYVKNTAITFEYTTPTIEEFRGRMEKTMQKYPYLVAEKDGVIVYPEKVVVGVSLDSGEIISFTSSDFWQNLKKDRTFSFINPSSFPAISYTCSRCPIDRNSAFTKYFAFPFY